MFDNIVSFYTNLDVSSIHRSAGAIAKVISMSLSPVLLIIAIYIRILRDSLDSFSSNSSGMWARVVRDILLWGTVLAVYFALGNLIINFSNDIYRWADEIGGLKLLTADMGAASKAIDAKMDQDGLGGSILTALSTGGGSLMLITGFFYYLSLLIVAVLVAALKIAHALVFGFAFIWGLVAIPVSVSQGIKLLRGWGLLIGFALLWPLVQAILVALIRPAIIGALNTIMTNDTNAGVDMMSSDLLMTVLNMLFAATLLSAPYLASALVSNSPAASAMVTPFVSAAMAGVASVVGGTMKGTSGGAKSASQSLMGAIRSESAPAVSAKGSFSGGGSGSSPRPAKETAAPGAAASPAPASAPSAPSADAAKKQQRRGVILSQLNKGKPK